MTSIICSQCNQEKELEMIPGTKKIVIERNKKGEAISIRCGASFRRKALCYYCNKKLEGLISPGRH